ncbi:hypothetical protein Amsp01_099100 [Amycolatopsis sp. NBRC 101858]|nr:hypothetical protein Amsp01_099100 [Amycolatopsis sp. NBRC 101858]
MKARPEWPAAAPARTTARPARLDRARGADPLSIDRLSRGKPPVTRLTNLPGHHS